MTLTDSPRVRRTDPITSHEAADSNDLEGSQRVVMGLLDGEPMADHEMVALFQKYMGSYRVKYTPQRLRSARAELVELGRVEDTGIFRLTPTGRRAHVWAVKS